MSRLEIVPKFKGSCEKAPREQDWIYAESGKEADESNTARMGTRLTRCVNVGLIMQKNSTLHRKESPRRLSFSCLCRPKICGRGQEVVQTKKRSV